MPYLHELIGGPLAQGTPFRTGGGVLFRALDATLGHAGLPQSATGQTALLTGRNGADAMAGHYGPWPGPTLKELLRTDTLFHAAPAGARLANVYPPGWFDAVNAGRTRVNVPVYAATAAGVSLLDVEDYLEGRGVAADLTGAYAASVDARVTTVAPDVAGGRLAAQATDASFTFFDFWLTDRIGHRGSFEDAVEVAIALDGFIGGLVDALDGVTLLVTSDHGNFEDKGLRTHTRNPVPLLVVGPHAETFASCTSIMELAPTVRGAWRA